MSLRGFHLSASLVAICALCAPAASTNEPPVVPDFTVIDDFERYTDEYGDRMYETWIDGWTNGTGSLIGYTDTGDHPNAVHSGTQAMPLEYNNVDPPCYSEVYRTWEAPQDWTINNVADLSLWFRGQPSNDPAPLYVMVEDSARASAVITHPDPRVVLADQWAEWQIPLSAFSRAGVNLKSIKRMYIGVGDRNHPQPDGSGRIFIDDIRLLQRVRAADPYPADTDVNVPQSLTLRWSPGSMATHHGIYFGVDPNAVANATPATTGIYRGRQTRNEATFEPSTLEWNKTYYWRIDEVNDIYPDSPWKGNVWRFTTADFLIIDDFESYSDEEGYRIYETWIDAWSSVSDGWLDSSMSLERQIVQSGRQSMAFDYNNVFSPYYSEADLWFAAAQDWTVNDADTLVLFVRGLATNDPVPIYVSIEDSTHKADTVVHSDPQLTATTEWIEWQIPLGRLTNINPAKVRQFRIGVGNPEDRHPGGLGRIYIDDIRVIKSGQ